jgi:hypothetical protein
VLASAAWVSHVQLRATRAFVVRCVNFAAMVAASRGDVGSRALAPSRIPAFRHGSIRARRGRVLGEIDSAPAGSAGVIFESNSSS